MITIVITTKNRPELVIRQLNYYVNQNFAGEIILGDASDKCHAEQLEAFIRTIDKRLHIKHLKHTGASVPKSYSIISENISTPFAVINSDGAFLVPNALYECARFLENNSDYAIAHGRAALFELNTSDLCGPMKRIGPYRLPVHEEKTAAERLTAYLEHYGVLECCVMRSDVWKKMKKGMEKITNPEISGEVLPGCLAVTYGKVHEINLLYQLRHMHAERTRLPPILDLMVAPDWSESIMLMRSTLVQRIVDQDHVSEKYARKVVDDALYYYFANELFRYLLPNKTFAKKLRDGKHVPVVVSDRVERVLAAINYWVKHAPPTIYLLGITKKISLKGLLNPANPYHNDFMPIYKAVTGKNNLSA